VLNGGYSPSKITDGHLEALRNYLDEVVDVLSKRSGKKKEIAALGRADIESSAITLKALHDNYMRTGDAQPSLARYTAQVPGILEAANVKLWHSFTPRIPFDWSVNVFGWIVGIGSAILGSVLGAYLAHIWK